MFQKLEIVQTARALAAFSGQRLSVISQNIANADTPGYRAKDLPAFSSVLMATHLDLRQTRPAHVSSGSSSPPVETIFAPGPMAPDGNDVNLDLQMLRAAEARQSHEMALAIYRSSSAIVRASLGRNG